MDGENTLRSTLGWRLLIERLPTGETLAEWRCPDCWAKYKARRRSMPPPKS
jgi:N-acetyl-beta-hexosaminidase